MKLSAIIVDDEYLAIKVLESYASSLDYLDIVGIFKDAREAVKFLQNHEVDVLFLDIQMPYLDGFAVLNQLDSPPMIIFTTARHDYAVKAFEVDAVDYLVKPVSFERFSKSVQKALDTKKLLENDHPALEEKRFITINSNYQAIKLSVADIVYLEGWNEYVKIYTVDDMFITLSSLKKLLSQLPQGTFIQIQKSFIISLDFIKSYSCQKVKMKNGRELPIGRVYKKEFLERIKKN
jgi:DNA-binding LytR/AlgR family response regulator